MKRSLPLLFLLALLTACQQNARRDAEFANSPEMWEGFLERYPDYTEASDVRRRIDQLRFSRAKSQGEIEAFEDYLSHHPEGSRVAEAKAALDRLTWRAAQEANTLAAYSGYLNAYPSGAFIEDARKRHDGLDYLAKLRVGEPQLDRTNMAEDPEGALNGWRLRADVTNDGERTLRVVEISVDTIDEAGKVLKTDQWWAVAPDLGIRAATPAMRPPLEPGGVRTFEWTIADVDLDREAKTRAGFVPRATAVQFVK